MTLLMVVLLGAGLLWLLCSVFFEKIGGFVMKICSCFKNDSVNKNEGEKKNE